MSLMVPEVKAEWGVALLSGNYSQSRGQLESPAGFCCLGVLCHLAWKAEVVSRATMPDGIVLYRAVGDDGQEIPTPRHSRALPLTPWAGSRVYLPASVMEWAGLAEMNPQIEVDGMKWGLGALNDALWPFKDIWEVIDSQL